jgi:sigma-B regulation protein RsbU (phosphoserine phosphatase)
MKILIAEDDQTSQRVLQLVLSKWDYQVVESENGSEAWDVLQADQTMQMAIFDWMMPEMDGLELIRRIRASETLSGMYIILLTAKGRTEDIVAGLEAGANDYVAKPFKREELMARVGVGRRVAELQKALALRVGELEATLAEIKTLKGLIPMCASCKKIRDDQGFWQQVEGYLMQHSQAEFSHGLCPECMEKHYPEYFEIMRKKEEVVR